MTKFFNLSSIKKLLFPLFLFFLLYYTKQLGFLFYNSTNSPDFSNYFEYIEYFSGYQNSTNNEQGLIYYYIHYLNLYFSTVNTELPSMSILVHKSIQNVNFYIFIFGLVGYYLLLDFFTFSKSTIYGILIFLSLFPVLIAGRLIFKPEILAISIFPWLIYCLEKYLEKGKIKFIICLIPLLVIILTLKGSILGIVSFTLGTFYLGKVYKKNRKYFKFYFLTFVILFLFINFENNTANNRNILDLTSGSIREAKYDNKANIDVIYKLNLYNLVSSPIKHDHAGSFLGITLLDTFGDYFDLYWNNDNSNFSKDRKEVLVFEENKKIKLPKFSFDQKKITFYLQNLTETYPRKFLGLLFSLLFYFNLFKYLFKWNEYSKFLSFWLIGISLVLIHIISGYPSNNYDPYTGDTLKPYYYSFVLVFSLVFLLAQILEKNKKILLLIIPYIFSALFILGFPKEENISRINNTSVLNGYSSVCEVNNIIFNNHLNDQYDCRNIENRYLQSFDDYENFQIKSFKTQFINLVLLFSSLVSSFYLLYERKFSH